MNRSDLIAIIAEQLCKSKIEVDAFLNAFMDVITEEVSEGNKVQLAGFGTFERRERPPRKGRNPQTGEILDIPLTFSPVFKPGKNFKRLVNA